MQVGVVGAAGFEIRSSGFRSASKGIRAACLRQHRRETKVWIEARELTGGGGGDADGARGTVPCSHHTGPSIASLPAGGRDEPKEEGTEVEAGRDLGEERVAAFATAAGMVKEGVAEAEAAARHWRADVQSVTSVADGCHAEGVLGQAAAVELARARCDH